MRMRLQMRRRSAVGRGHGGQAAVPWASRWRRGGAGLGCAVLALGVLGAPPASAEPRPAATPATPSAEPTPALTRGPARSSYEAVSGPGTVWSAQPGRGDGQSVEDAVSGAEDRMDRQLPVLRAYYRWDSGAPSGSDAWACSGGRALAWSVLPRTRDGGLISWGRIAAARPGEPLHEDMRAWGARAAAMPCPVIMIFHHEPEMGRQPYGSPAEFAAAWRTFVDAVRSTDGGKVTFTWTMTAYAFTPPGQDEGAVGQSLAAAYYPGDAWVDDIGADGYNWLACKGRDTGWRDFATIFRWHRAFGALHPDKTLAVPEWASVEDGSDPGRKAAWIRDAADRMREWTEQGSRFRWVNYFDRPYQHDSVCGWQTTTSPQAQAAFREAGLGEAFQARVG